MLLYYFLLIAAANLCLGYATAHYLGFAGPGFGSSTRRSMASGAEAESADDAGAKGQ